MKVKITVLDTTEKYLDKRIKIKDNMGMAWDVDSFRVLNVKKSSAEIMFIQLKDKGFDRESGRGIYSHIAIMRKIKRISFVDNELLIKIDGLQYKIGTYEEI